MDDYQLALLVGGCLVISVIALVGLDLWLSGWFERRRDDD